MQQAISRRDIVYSYPTSLRNVSSPENNLVSELQNLTMKDGFSRKMESELA
jgi:hypothetical protein